jgi:uncharacterized protein (DUF2062 family)
LKRLASGPQREHSRFELPVPFLIPVQKFHSTFNLLRIYLRSLNMRQSTVPALETIRLRAAVCLRQGISPRRLALALALGFALGCIPIFGLPTALCAMIALAFRLNQPLIQAANYAAMPFQLALIIPLARLGAKLIPLTKNPGLNLGLLSHSPAQLLSYSPRLVIQLGGIASQALVAWLLLAIPVVVLLTPTLTLVLRRVPALSTSESGD